MLHQLTIGGVTRRLAAVIDSVVVVSTVSYCCLKLLTVGIFICSYDAGKTLTQRAKLSDRKLVHTVFCLLPMIWVRVCKTRGE